MGKRILLTLINHLLLVSLTCYGCSLQDKDRSFETAEESEAAFEQNNTAEAALIRKSAHSLSGAANDYDPLMKMIGDAHTARLKMRFFRRRSR